MNTAGLHETPLVWTPGSNAIMGWTILVHDVASNLPVLVNMEDRVSVKPALSTPLASAWRAGVTT
jgi:hypothetical protein